MFEGSLSKNNFVLFIFSTVDRKYKCTLNQKQNTIFLCEIGWNEKRPKAGFI